MYFLKNNSAKNLFSINGLFVSSIAIVLACVLLAMIIINPATKIPFICLFVFPSILILVKPKLGIWIILLFVFYFNYLADESFVPSTFTWIVEVSLFALCISLFVQIVLEKRQLKTSPIDYLLLILVFSGLISAFINHNLLMSTLLGYRKLLKMVLMFYFIVHMDFEEAFLKKIIKFLFFAALIQGPVAVVQYFTWTPELEHKLLQLGAFGGTGIFDFSSGTTGITGITAIYVMDFMCILIAFMLIRKVRLTDIFKWMLLLIPIIVGNSKASFLYLPVIILFMLRQSLFTDIKKGLLVVVFFMIFYFSLIKFAPLVGYDISEWVSTPSEQFVSQSHFNPEGQPVGRISNIIFAKSLMKSLNNNIFGFGPNSMSVSSFGGAYSGSIVTYLVSKDFVYSADSFTNSQIAFMMLEWGFLGLGIYIFIIVRIYLMNRKFYLAIDDPYWKTLSFGFSGIILLYGITSFYKKLWVVEETSCLFWVLAGIIYSVGRKRSIF